MPEVTEEYVHIPVRDKGDFQSKSFRTIPLNANQGIHAVIGRLKGKTTTTVQKYLFEIDKGWTLSKAQAWVKKHKAGHRTKAWSMRASGYEGNPDLRVVLEGDTFRLMAPTEWERLLAESAESDVAVFSIGKDDALAFDHVEPDKNGVPKAFRIVKFGPWHTDKYGTLKVGKFAARGTMAWYDYKGMPELPMDWSHKSADATDERSAGWWKPEVREDGIWATGVRWTPDAYKQLEKGEYKHFSPEGKHNGKTGEVLAITYIALTNRPASNYQLPLVASSPVGETPPPQEEVIEMKELLKKLGLNEEATEDEAIAAVEALEKKVPAEAEKAHTDAIKAKDEELAELRTKTDQSIVDFRTETLKACGLREGDGFDKVLAYVTTLQSKAPEADRAAKLETEVADLKKFREDVRVEKLVAGVEKKVTPANREAVEKMARTFDDTTFLATMEGFPEVKGDSPTPAKGSTVEARNTDVTQDPKLDDGDREFFKAQGWDPRTPEGKKEIEEFIAAK